jgi:hypothetical protein
MADRISEMQFYFATAASSISGPIATSEPSP